MPQYEYGEMRGRVFANGRPVAAKNSITALSLSSMKMGRYMCTYSKQVVWNSGGGVTRLRLSAWGGRQKHTRYELMRTVRATPANIWARALALRIGRQTITVSVFRVNGLIGLLIHTQANSGESTFPLRPWMMRCVIGLGKVLRS